MTNDLKNFLLVERTDLVGTYLTNEDDSRNLETLLKDHDTRLINFVLDLVEKEVEKKYKEAERFVPFQKIHYQSALKDISTIINNLRVK